jgi:hypothetical protein
VEEARLQFLGRFRVAIIAGLAWTVTAVAMILLHHVAGWLALLWLPGAVAVAALCAAKEAGRNQVQQAD